MSGWSMFWGKVDTRSVPILGCRGLNQPQSPTAPAVANSSLMKPQIQKESRIIILPKRI